MSEFDTRLAALAAHLTTSCPLRVVTRSLKDFALREDADLTDGILTVVGGGAGRFRNLRERLGMDATQRVTLVGQLRVAEAAEPLAVEQAEFTLYDEVIAARQAGAGCSDEMAGRDRPCVPHRLRGPPGPGGHAIGRGVGDAVEPTGGRGVVAGGVHVSQRRP